VTGRGGDAAGGRTALKMVRATKQTTKAEAARARWTRSQPPPAQIRQTASRTPPRLSQTCRFCIGDVADILATSLGRSSQRTGNVNPYLLGLVLLFGWIRTAAATGPAGGTGVTTAIPGSIVRWQPGDPAPLQGGLLSILTSPNPSSPALSQPAGRDTRFRKQ
jgi:hypothetical protein